MLRYGVACLLGLLRYRQTLAMRDQSEIRMDRVSSLPVPVHIDMTSAGLGHDLVLCSNLGKSNVGAGTANPVQDALTEHPVPICKSLPMACLMR